MHVCVADILTTRPQALLNTLCAAPGLLGLSSALGPGDASWVPREVGPGRPPGAEKLKIEPYELQNEAQMGSNIGSKWLPRGL